MEVPHSPYKSPKVLILDTLGLDFACKVLILLGHLLQSLDFRGFDCDRGMALGKVALVLGEGPYRWFAEALGWVCSGSIQYGSLT
jgi:hypothetical protein